MNDERGNMALIEIRDPTGTRLAAADDISTAIAQLVALCSLQRETIRRYQVELARMASCNPDISATAPEHVGVFSAGWRACQDSLRQIEEPSG